MRKNINEVGVFGALGAYNAFSDASNAYDRYKEGDVTGAVAQSATAALGAASLIPGPIGWTSLIASMAAGWVLDEYDKKRITDFLSSLPKDADPEVATIQIAINQLGGKINVDGKISPEFTALFNQYKTKLEDLE